MTGSALFPITSPGPVCQGLVLGEIFFAILIKLMPPGGRHPGMRPITQPGDTDHLDVLPVLQHGYELRIICGAALSLIQQRKPGFMRGLANAILKVVRSVHPNRVNDFGVRAVALAKMRYPL
jgi:hypothetical protein